MIAIRRSDDRKVIAREVIDLESVEVFLLSFNIDPTKTNLSEGDWIIVDLAQSDDEQTDVRLISPMDFLDDYDEEWSG